MESNVSARRSELREKEMLALRNKVKEEKHSTDTRGVEGRYWNQTYLHGAVNYAKRLKLRFRVGDLDLPERRKRYTSSREEDVGTNICPCGTTIESRTHIVGKCEVYKEERDALEEGIRKLDVCDMEEFGRPESSEKTIAILGDRW